MSAFTFAPPWDEHDTDYTERAVGYETFESPWDKHDADYSERTRQDALQPPLDAYEADDSERGPLLSLSLRIDPVSKALIRHIDGTPHPLDVQHAATFAKVTRAVPDCGRTMPVPPTARLRRTCVPSQFGELPRLEWLMEPLIPRRSIGIIFGSSGVGKSAFLIDLGIAFAPGRLWANRFDVVKGAVLICCQEGEEGMRTRAFISTRAEDPAVSARLHFCFDALNIGAEADIDDLAATIVRLGAFVVFIDTLSASLAGALEENSTSDMAKMIGLLRRLIRMTGVTVILIHHTGHQDGRERGASVLRRDVDVSIMLTRKGSEIEWRTVKAKDGPSDICGRFELEPVEGLDAQGVWQQSISVKHCDQIESVTSARPTKRLLSSNQAKVLETVKTLLSEQAISASDKDSDAPYVERERAVSACLGHFQHAAQKHRSSRARETLQALVDNGHLTNHDERLRLAN